MNTYRGCLLNSYLEVLLCTLIHLSTQSSHRTSNVHQGVGIGLARINRGHDFVGQEMPVHDLEQGECGRVVSRARDSNLLWWIEIEVCRNQHVPQPSATALHACLVGDQDLFAMFEVALAVDELCES